MFYDILYYLECIDKSLIFADVILKTIFLP